MFEMSLISADNVDDDNADDDNGDDDGGDEGKENVGHAMQQRGVAAALSEFKAKTGKRTDQDYVFILAWQFPIHMIFIFMT